MTEGDLFLKSGVKIEVRIRKIIVARTRERACGRAPAKTGTGLRKQNIGKKKRNH